MADIIQVLYALANTWIPGLGAMFRRLYRKKFDQTGNIQDLEDAIKYAREALNKTPSNHLMLATMLSDLGSQLSDRYDRMGNMQDLEDAIKNTQAAVNITTSGHPKFTYLAEQSWKSTG